MFNQLSLFDGEEKQYGTREPGSTVISASRRTDIPAFFYSWLQETLVKGSVEVPNPIFPNITYHIDLKPESIHTIVLWSKNFYHVLMEPGQLSNYNLYFQYTINNYSGILEPNVPPYKQSIRILEGLQKSYRPEQFNIRFDPVIISTRGEVTPTPDMPQRARRNAFEQLCRDLKTLGMEHCRVTTSYISLYGHVRNSMEKSGVDMVYLDEKQQIDFFSQLEETAQKYGISLYSCASPVVERVKGIQKGRCIDGELLEKLFGGKVKKSKDNGQRKECGCTSSREIGTYAGGINGMKCLHGCKYCYVGNAE